MSDAIKGKILIKTGNTNFWTVAHADKVLDLGQLGYNTETKEFKTGDGVHPWATLTSHTHQVSDIVDDNGKTVQQLYDELTIGGRNLIKNSTFITGLDGYSVTGKVYTIERSTTEKYHEQNSLKIVGTAAGTSEANIEIQLTQKCEIYSNYIFSCWIKAIQPTTVTIRFGDSTNANVANVTTSWTKITIPLKSGGSQIAYAYMTFGGACEAYLCCLNLERGNKASDHTPAPEEKLDVAGGTINGSLNITGSLNANGVNMSACEYLPAGDGSLTYWESIPQGKYCYNVDVGPVTGIPEGYGIVEVSKSSSEGVVLFYCSTTFAVYRLDYTATTLVDWKPLSIKKVLWSGEQSSGQFLLNDDMRKYKMLLIHQKGAGADIPIAFTGQGLYVSGCSGYCSNNDANKLIIYHTSFGVQTFYGGNGNKTLLNFYTSNYWLFDSGATSKEISKSTVIPIQYIYGVC